MSLVTREQKAVMTDFAGDGPFGPFGRQKDMKERLEENASEHLRLRAVVEYNGERKRLFLIHPPTFAVEPKTVHINIQTKKTHRSIDRCVY